MSSTLLCLGAVIRFVCAAGSLPTYLHNPATRKWTLRANGRLMMAKYQIAHQLTKAAAFAKLAAHNYKYRK
jgi:hypothetical protein